MIQSELLIRDSLVTDKFSIVEESHIDHWKQKIFAFPNATIKLGTLFSGIGAIEQAFKRLNLKTSITFATYPPYQVHLD